MKALSLALAVVLLCQSTSLAFATPARQTNPQETLVRLTNKEVMEMVRAGLSADVIIAKIKRSRCNFDTFPGVLAEMKRNGVPEAVILAMIEAPYGMPQQTNARSVTQRQAQNSTDPEVPSQEVIIPDGKDFNVLTTEEITSKTATEGDPITFRVAEDVVVNGHIVIARGALVKGQVTNSKKRGMMGRGGSLGIRVDSTVTIDNQKLKLRAAKGKEGGDAVGSTVALVVLFGPLGFLKKGGNAQIKAGTSITVYTDEAKAVRVPLIAGI